MTAEAVSTPAREHRGSILVVDDEKNIRRILRMIFEEDGYEVLDAATGEEALERLARSAVHLVLLDLFLPGMNGLDVLKQIVAEPDAPPVIMISGHAGVREAVQAVRMGAVDFFEKPLDRDRVLISAANALEMRGLRWRLSEAEHRLGKADDIIGGSPAMREVWSKIEKVAPTAARVLITGESGTGKELVARALHEHSARAKAPFVKVNCAAIPGELIESELFGHEKGAFTGAVQRKRGLMEAAHCGTLFLDEVGDMSLAAQAKVLRALQTGEVQRVGSEQVLHVDVRVIAATNRDLAADVTHGRFREDLYFRLNVVPLELPPLRERGDDIPALVSHFLTAIAASYNMKRKAITDDALEVLKGYHWPGNIRELRNMVERLLILGGDPIVTGDLPPSLRASRPAPAPSTPSAPDGLSLREVLRVVETEYIQRTLKNCDGNVTRAAELLGLDRTNLHKKLKSLGLERG